MKAILIKSENTGDVLKENITELKDRSYPNINFDVPDKWNDNELNDWKVNEKEGEDNG